MFLVSSGAARARPKSAIYWGDSKALLNNYYGHICSIKEHSSVWIYSSLVPSLSASAIRHLHTACDEELDWERG